MGSQDHGKNGERLYPGNYVLNLFYWERFGFVVKSMWPSNKSCRSVSDRAIFDGRRSLKSTYLPETIWLTIFAGTKEKPRPTANS